VYRFLLSPRWILWHLFVLAVVAGMVWAGFWQLRRLDERKAANAEVRAAQQLDTAPIAEVLPEGPSASDEQVDAVRYRSVTFTGTYRADEQVLVRNRSLSGSPGYWVITPMELGDGTAVAVNRGWVGYDVQPEGPWEGFDPPGGPVTVTGSVHAPQVRDAGALVPGAEDAAEGRLTTLARVDVGRLQQQTDADLYPLYVDLRSQAPAQPDGLPVPLPGPELDEGSHLSYAGQWFIFATLTVIVDVLLVRRSAKGRLAGRRRGGDDSSDDDDGGLPRGDGPDRPPVGASTS
jgi:surfeit locus 1 family protein